MTTYSSIPFLRLEDVRTGAFVVLNVTSFEEEEYEWSGAERRAFDGTMLSTLRTPKRRARATVEVNTSAELVTLQRLVSAGVDPVTQQITALQKVAVTGVGTQAGPPTYYAYVHLTNKKPWFYEVATVLQTGWIAELDIREV